MSTPINGNKTTAEKMQPANRSLRSREMNEVISVRPGFIINWGMYIMLGIFCIVIFLTTFMKFPETVNVDVSINNTSAVNNPGKYIASGNVRLKAGESIKPGQKAFLQLGNQENIKLVEGNVASVSTLSADSGYTITISIPQQTGQGYNQPVSAKASINVGKHTLFNRLFANLLPSFKKKETKL